MARTIARLNPRQVINAKPRRGRATALLADGGNLYLQVTASRNDGISRSWLFRYELDGRRRDMGIGSVQTISLAEAREKARHLRQQLLVGIDPLEARRQQRADRRLEAAKAMTFGECVTAYLAAHDRAWKNAKHRAQWAMTLTEYCKAIAPFPVKEVDLVLRVLTPLWTTKTETAKRLRGRIERVLAWAKGRGLRDGENPARWSGHLNEMLPKPSKLVSVKHHAAVPYHEVAVLMAALRERDPVSARALEFTVLTAARTGEVRGARWDEIDLKSRTWTIPAARMKPGVDHAVPLSEGVVSILETLPRRGELVFAGAGGKPLSDMALLRELRGLRPNTTTHGFRSSFRTWASEQTNFPHEICEAALAHKPQDAMVRAYRRTDFFERRRKLMQTWADFCTKPAPTGTVVTPLRRQADA
jgi:integrase